MNGNTTIKVFLRCAHLDSDTTDVSISTISPIWEDLPEALHHFIAALAQDV
jgi:hypothetical protein